MKIFVISFLVICLSGCQSIDNSASIEGVNNSANESSGTGIIDTNIGKLEGKEDDLVFMNNAKSQDIRLINNDCVSSSSTLGGTGNLLKNLSENTPFRNALQAQSNNLKLSVYTPEYIQTLEKDITIGFPGFIVRYLCNIDTDTDVIAGIDYTQSVSDYNSLDEKSKSNMGLPRAGMSDTLFIRNKSQIAPIESSVMIYNSTVTGGDVDHCKATKKNETIIWSCSIGNPRNEGKETREYTIDIVSGKILNTRDY